jgi:hypothetical protein
LDEHHSDGDVSGGVDVRDGSLQIVIDDDVAFFVVDAGFLEFAGVDVTHPADG